MSQNSHYNSILNFQTLFCGCFFYLLVMSSSEIPKLPTDPLFGNFSSFTTPSSGQVSIPNSFVSLFVFCILSYFFSKRMCCISGAWCPLPVFRSCFEEVAQHSNDLLMNLWGRKWSPCPIPPPSQDHPNSEKESDCRNKSQIHDTTNIMKNHIPLTLIIVSYAIYSLSKRN